jgi:hypothetical protein
VHRLRLDPGSSRRADDAVEVQTGNALKLNAIIGDSAFAFWDALLDQGRHLPALGGSDDHRAGVDLTFFQSPIGDPTTLVLADELSVQAIIDGVKKGRTVVKLVGPDSPMIVLPRRGAGVTSARLPRRFEQK